MKQKNVSLVHEFTRFFFYFRFLFDEGPKLKTLDFTIRIVNTPTFPYFDLYLYSIRFVSLLRTLRLLLKLYR